MNNESYAISVPLPRAFTQGHYAPPSQLPLATISSVSGFLAMVSTASTCPSRLAMNGFANMRSILSAFSARVRSRARAKECMRGSRFREVGVGSPGRAGRCVDGACWSTDIFCFRITQLMRTRTISSTLTTMMMKCEKASGPTSCLCVFKAWLARFIAQREDLIASIEFQIRRKGREKLRPSRAQTKGS